MNHPARIISTVCGAGIVSGLLALFAVPRGTVAESFAVVTSVACTVFGIAAGFWYLRRP